MRVKRKFDVFRVRKKEKKVIRLQITAVGKCEGIYKGASEEYIKRINRFAKAEIVEVKEQSSGGSEKEIAASKEKEGEALLSKSDGCLIALDKGGEEWTSEEFAAFLARCAANGVSKFSFLIGGSDGLSRQVLKRADKTVSFGKMTLPHQLARLVLSEQLYRAMTILNNVTYHK